MYNLYKKIKDYRNMYLIKKSGYFDYDYYKKEYPNVKGNLLKHYYYEGFKLGYNPSEKFSNNFYTEHNLDIKQCGINPLYHYIVSGKNEGREIKKNYGMTLNELFTKVYKLDFYCNIRIKKDNTQSLTFFLKDDLNIDTVNMIINIINKCVEKNIKIKIIYNNIEIDNLFNRIDDKIKNKISLLKWNIDYYLELNINEICVFNNFSMMFSILNNKLIENNLYFLDTSINNLNNEQLEILSLYQQNNKVITIGDKELNTYKLKINNNIKNRINSKKVNIVFNFKTIDPYMLKLYNDLVINNYLKKQINYFYISEDFKKNLCFENDKTIKNTSKINNLDLVINYKVKKDNSINIDIEKTEDRIKSLKVDRLFEKNNNIIINVFENKLLKELKEIGLGD